MSGVLAAHGFASVLASVSVELVRCRRVGIPRCWVGVLCAGSAFGVGSADLVRTMSLDLLVYIAILFSSCSFLPYATSCSLTVLSSASLPLSFPLFLSP